MKEFTERQIEIMKAATQRIDRYGIQNLTTKTLAADIGLSEPALYRHFDSKTDILSSLLTYFTCEMKERLSGITPVAEMGAGEELRAVFDSQLKAFVKKPAIVRSEERRVGKGCRSLGSTYLAKTSERAAYKFGA